MYIFNNINLFQYFICSSLLFTLSFFALYYKSKELDVFVSFLTFIVFLIFLVSRTGLGVDELTYRLEYSGFNYDYSDFKFEYGFYALFSLFKYLGVSIGAFNLFFTILFLSLTCLVVYKVESKYRSIVILSLFFSSVYIDLIFNAYRQGAAVIFVICMAYYFTRGQKVKFIISAFFAIGFHWSSVLILLFLLLSRFLSHRVCKAILVTLAIGHACVVFVKLDVISVIPIDIFDSLGVPTLSNAINAYLNLKLDGNTFYDSNFAWKLIAIIPILSSIIITLHMYNNDVLYVKVFTVTMMYSFLMIGMAYGFRNYYWALPFFSFMLPGLLNDAGPKRLALVYIYLIIFSFFGFYYSSIIPMIYL